MIEAEKLKRRSTVLYDYIALELIKFHARVFTEEYLAKNK